MVKTELITDLKKKFKFILEEPRILGLFLFGSQTTGDETTKSDVDLCFIVPNKSQIVEMYQWIMKHGYSFSDEYDIRFFEELPIQIKIQIIEKGIPLVARDVLDVYEYFWKYRQIWEDYQITLSQAS